MGKNNDWEKAALGLGIGVLALYFLKKLTDNKNFTESIQTCQYCGHVAEKWARACPSCRNTFPI